MSNKKKALGKGLAAILSSPDTDITSRDISGNYVVGAIANISLDNIELNPFQPRKNFDEDSLRELADSINEQGIIQPLTVRKLGYEKYQLISGERRLKAAKIAGLSEAPCYIRVANDEQMLEMALIENIHRDNLNAIEIAISYQRLIDECNLTHEKLSDRIGKNRSTITNYLRLLKLPAEIQIALKDGKISMGHARAIITVPEENKQKALCLRIISDQLSVRELEDIVRNKEPETIKDTISKSPTQRKQKNPVELPEVYVELKNDLSNIFDAEIGLKINNKGKGHIVIPFDSEEDFSRILEILRD